MLAGQKIYWVGGSIPGDPRVFNKCQVTYKKGDELPSGVLSDKTAEAYEKLGWITDQDPNAKVEVKEVIEAPAKVVVEPPKPTPPSIQVEEEVEPVDDTPVQVEKEFGLSADVPVQEEMSSGPKSKPNKKSKKGKRHG